MIPRVVRHSRCFYRYSPFSGIRETAKQREQKTKTGGYLYAGKRGSDKELDTSGGEGIKTDRSATIRRREGSGVRPLQSSVADKQDAQRAFPETLPSGRPAQQNTISQQIFKRSLHGMAEAREAYHEQMSREREYERLMKETQSGKMDRRFFSKFSDYRQIQDNDPYSSVFGESKTTQRVRTAAWQRQFEEENKDTFLPYERDSTLKRLAPNWFVRYFVKMRDNGGADSAMMLYVMFAFTVSTLCLIAYMFYTAPSRARPVEEVR